MRNFILVALPWVVVILFLAVLIIKRNISKKQRKKVEDYSTEGMSIGMCLGCAIGASNIMNIGIALSLGMLFGLAIGMLIKKGESGEKDDVLSVEYSIDRGNVDLVIGLEKEKPIYKGNDIEDGKFGVIVPRDGEYRITVKAKHAAGSMAIIKNQCMDEK